MDQVDYFDELYIFYLKTTNFSFEQQRQQPIKVESNFNLIIPLISFKFNDCNSFQNI